MQRKRTLWLIRHLRSEFGRFAQRGEWAVASLRSNVFSPEMVTLLSAVPFSQRDHATGLVIGWRQHAIFNQSADIAILTYHKFPGQPWEKAVTRPSSQISPLELIRSDSGEAIARMQSASSYLRSLFKGQPQLQNMNQAQERGMER
jgi:hypothetical protein